MFTNNLIAGASGSQGFYPFKLDQSLRFNDDDSARLTRTPASAGNRTTWTFSAWVKRGNFSTNQNILREDTGDNLIRFESSNSFRFFTKPADSGCDLTTSAVFRDASAWYHIVCVYDTTQATSSERAKVYINGNRITQFSTETYPAQNHDSYINNNVIHGLGGRPTGGEYYDGYLAEVNFIDGTALDPTDFGEFKSGVWVAKSYAGSYGTNGFYLNFSDSANIGDDLSGNANDWTANNLVATDVVLDSPTNNFCTFNPNIGSFDDLLTYSEGSLFFSQAASTGNASQMNSQSTFGFSSGKWYWEYANVSNQVLGFSINMSQEGTYTPSIRGYYISNGTMEGFGCTAPSSGATWTSSDVIGLAFDADNGTLALYKNNSLQGTFTNIPVGNTYFAITIVGSSGSSGACAVNFGQDSSFAGNKTAQGNTDDNGVGDFYYAPPSGYLALCTANLPDPAIDPAQDDVPADYFNTVLGTGTGSTQSISVGFQPDFLWIKRRDAAINHALYDGIRGGVNALRSNTTGAESQFATDTVITYEADGFEIAGGTSSGFNGSGDSFVAWNWLAGNGTSSNTDGSITSTVSVNQKAGFSIVKVDSLPASTLSTFGHGLGVKPDLIILKSRNNATNWDVYHSSLSPDGERKLYLNGTNSVIDSGFMGDTPPTSSVISFNPGSSTSNHIVYCFHSVEGYSKFGSYTGNGSGDGPFVYTGFRPAWVMVKRTDSTGSWFILDSRRDIDNPANLYLTPNNSNQELDLQTTDAKDFHDFLSNGFKLVNNGNWDNASGGTYIYMAFAENPFKYANAR